MKTKRSSNPYQDRLDIAESLFGSIPADMTLEEAREGRLNKNYISPPSMRPDEEILEST